MTKCEGDPSKCNYAKDLISSGLSEAYVGNLCNSYAQNCDHRNSLRTTRTRFKDAIGPGPAQFKPEISLRPDG